MFPKMYFIYPSGKEPAENILDGKDLPTLEGGWTNLMSITFKADKSDGVSY